MITLYSYIFSNYIEEKYNPAENSRLAERISDVRLYSHWYYFVPHHLAHMCWKWVSSRIWYTLTKQAFYEFIFYYYRLTIKECLSFLTKKRVSRLKQFFFKISHSWHLHLHIFAIWLSLLLRRRLNPTQYYFILLCFI